MEDFIMPNKPLFSSEQERKDYLEELLQEYKQSLITEVVTGKRKVC